MLVKTVTLFLIAMAALALFGRLRWPPRTRPPAAKIAAPRRCDACGNPVIGGGPCACGGHPRA